MVMTQTLGHVMDVTANLKLYLLGRFCLERDGDAIQLPSRQAQALVAYLALAPTPLPRQKLATRNWGDETHPAASNSLRDALDAIRRELGEKIVLTEDNMLQLAPLWVDAREFQKMLTRSTVEIPESALELYAGDLLPDFSDDWVVTARARFRQMYVAALRRVIEQARAQADWSRAIDAARRILAVDRADEIAHQHLIASLAARGDVNAALKQYDQCVRILSEELGADPSPETNALRDQIVQTLRDGGSAPGRPPSGTVTFLFSDLESSTQLWEKFPDQMSPALARHDQILRRAIQAHHGYIVKTTGDGVHAAFALAVDAVHACLDAQRTLQTESWDENTPIRSRMGLHTGVADERGGDYYGSAVNRASRVMSAGHGGQVLISQTACELVREELPRGVTVRDLGEHRLKDLSRAEHLYQLVAPDLIATFPPLRTLTTRPNNLPVSQTPFIGRDKEIAQVKAMLASGRLVTLSGIGGGGKTRLGLQVAAEISDAANFRDGVFFVELAALTDPNRVAYEIAKLVGVKEEPRRAMLATLTDYLVPKNILLVLDNCEHLVDECTRVAHTLTLACPQLKILATSREALGIDGEKIYRVPPLASPAEKESPVLETLAQFDAVRLFVDRARAIRSNFQITPANAPIIAQICRRLDGIPLAIVLAAVRVKDLSVEDLATRLDDRFRLLTGGSPVIPRHQTLTLMMDWSHDLLTQDERALFRRLAVFIGSFSLQAVEKICADLPTSLNTQKELTENEILDLISELIDQSLITRDEECQETRYLILETVRQYALIKLIASGETEKLRGQHLNHFAELAEPSAKQTDAEQIAWLNLMAQEQDNLRAALGWALNAEGGAELGLRMSGALGLFWVKRNALSEGREWLKKFLALSQDSFDANIRARAFYEAGYLAHIQGDDAQAVNHYQQSLKIETQDVARSAQTHLDLGEAYGRLANYEAALKHLTQAMHLGETIRDSVIVALAQMRLGNVYHEQGDLERAVANHHKSLEAFRIADKQRYIATALMNLARVYFQRTEYPQAIEHYRQAIQMLENMGNPYTVCLIYSNLSEVYMDLGNYSEALISLDKCMQIAETMENDLLKAIAHRNRAECYLGLGDIEHAMEHVTRALQHDEKNQTPHQRGVIYRVRGEIFTMLGRSELARKDFEQARELLDPLNYKSRLARLYRSYGKLLMTQADTRAQGVGYVGRALSLFQTLGSIKEVEKTQILINSATDGTLEHIFRKEN